VFLLLTSWPSLLSFLFVCVTGILIDIQTLSPFDYLIPKCNGEIVSWISRLASLITNLHRLKFPDSRRTTISSIHLTSEKVNLHYEDNFILIQLWFCMSELKLISKKCVGIQELLNIQFHWSCNALRIAHQYEIYTHT